MSLTGSGEPRWEGGPVECSGGCGDHGIPALTEDGWRLRVHSMELPNGQRVTCPGSMAAVRL
ncbi:hypothetical protein I5G61_gp67 [Mycobacterium phage Quesadilla]|uniref:Uncharacterized protein n=1 Tax=Mycobacterium phage Quesadilla TaxID=2664226 RepID=A0A5Q2WFL6_9CAUD|nr:hypothetical protein I5G61_gp67 [Mycobacterium phage Quesadilla]QGH75315.1 hypothetical protein SEA_QUESADILLA_67 [Mycobacterium phage Quesadilla]